jgi:molybdate transport system substrate-binding protein
MRFVWLSLAAAMACKSAGPAEREPLKVAAAADLASAFKEVGDAYEKKTGDKVVFTFGSTGLLAKQISEGAPFDVFAAANISFVDDVVKAGACFEPTKSLYARGRIVVWTKSGPGHPDEPVALEDLADAKFAKIAIANPEHAPYGKAAQQALEKAGLYEAVRPRLVYGENVQQTLQFAQSGNADAAIVALSLAIVSDGKYSLVEAEQHNPLDQALVACKGSAQNATTSRAEATNFTDFVNSPDGRAIMKRFGFILPGESVAKDVE